MGRFINRDPIEEQGGINLYAFCRNDGVNKWDYLGMDPLSEWMDENLPQPEAPVFSTPVGGYPMDASIGTSFWSGHDDMEYDPRTASWVPSGSIMRDNVDFMSQAVQAIGDLKRLQARSELSGSIQLLGRNSSGDYVVAAYTPDAAVILASNSTATVFTGGMSLSDVTSLVGLARAPNSEFDPLLASAILNGSEDFRSASRGRMPVRAPSPQQIEATLMRRVAEAGKGGANDPVGHARAVAELNAFRAANGIRPPNSSGGPNAELRAVLPQLVTNPKHHPNSASPQPPNVAEIYVRSIPDSSGVRWSIDQNGVIHRFSRPSNGQSHWNGSTAGQEPIQQRNIPNEVLRQLEPGG